MAEEPDAGRRVPNFDHVARIYRLLEYATFGPMLERCRFCFLDELRACRRALVVGDGDGRFAARLVRAAPELRLDAVDASPQMLRLLQARARWVGAEDRVTAWCADAREFEPVGDDSDGYDLVATHFFLDCLTNREAEELVGRVRRHLAPGARWVVSEFAAPDDMGARAWLARGIIAGLYAAFGMLTGLRVRQIPEWRRALKMQGLRLRGSRTWLKGLLVAEVWEVEGEDRLGSSEPGSGTTSGMTTVLPG